MASREAAEAARPDVFRVGDHLALDFLNTTAAPRGVPIEWLSSGQDLLAWLVGSQVLAADEARRLASIWPASAIDAVAQEAVQFREWFRGLVARAVERGAPSLDTTEVRRINALLGRESSYAQLGTGDAGAQWRLARCQRWDAPEQLMALIAAQVADLFAGSDWGLVRQCENPQCTIWFYDRTKGHRRRWCSQAVCGNRAKVAAFRARQRGDG